MEGIGYACSEMLWAAGVSVPCSGRNGAAFHKARKQGVVGGGMSLKLGGPCSLDKHMLGVCHKTHNVPDGYSAAGAG